MTKTTNTTATAGNGNISLITPQMLIEKREEQINKLAEELFLRWVNSAKTCIEGGMDNYFDDGYIPWRDEYYSKEDKDACKMYSKTVQYKAEQRAKKMFREKLAEYNWKVEALRREGAFSLVFVEKVN